MAIYKTKTGYRIRYYDADGIERKRTIKGITREEAIRQERALLAKRDQGEAPPNARHAPAFQPFAQQWFDEHRANWKPSTRWQYAQVIKSQLAPHFATRRISNISESIILQAITAWVDAGLGPRRVNLALVVLKQILRSGKRKGWLRKDPTADIKILKVPVTEIDPLDPPDVALVLSHCPAWWVPYFTVAFWTGARPNELAALKWGDLDEPRQQFRIRAGRYRGIDGTPKTPSSVRDVAMLPPVSTAFQQQKAQQSAWRLAKGLGVPEPGADYVFTGLEGGAANTNFLRDRVWYPTLRRAKLPRRTMYQTRHSFASNALAAGESPSWVAAMLGHKSVKIVFEYYARYIPNRTRQDGSALFQHLTQGHTDRQPQERVAKDGG